MANPKYQSIPEWMQKVKKLCELDNGMSDREVDFVESMSHRPIFNAPSPKQVEWLNAIYERLFP